MPTDRLRRALARDGIFNVRDLGGLTTADGSSIAARRVLRADSLQRARTSVDGLRDYGLVRVIDLRDQAELDISGSFQGEGIDVVHLPVLDPAFRWSTEEPTDMVLAERYREILDRFGARFADGVRSIAEVVERGDGAVAFHCAVGKDRTGLLAALVLSMLGVPDDQIVADYVRSAASTAVQVAWLWSMGRPEGEVSDDELFEGVWSARAATMETTLSWLAVQHGGAERYLAEVGVETDVRAALRSGLLVAD